MPAGGRAACQGAAWGRVRQCSNMLCSTSTNLTRGSRSHGASSSGPSHSLRLGAPKAGTGLEQAVAANTDTLQWYEQSPMFYSNYPLDRAPALRKDPALLQQLLQLPAARTMLVAGRKLLVQSAPGTPAGTSSSAQQLSPVWFESPSSYLAAAGEPSLGPLFLGLDPETSAPCFAIQVKPSAEAGLTNEGRYSWAVARNAGPSMCAADAALAAVATGLAQWNLDARYHGSSGKQTVSTDAGFSRTCEDSGRAVYPRIDPAIITLVTAGSDWCLLGRKEGWPTGRYSTLAGFLELGETLEQALAREVLEEAGVAVELGSIRYQASQPWPFPRSLMVGFYASLADQQPSVAGGNGSAPATNSSRSQAYDPTSTSSSSSSGSRAGGLSPQQQQEEQALQQLCQLGRSALKEQRMKPADLVPYLLPQLPTPVPQPGEMSDVRWFHRDWLSWAISNEGQAPGSFAIPGPYSLAHHLITGWLQQQGQSAAGGAAPSSSSSSSSSGGDRQVPPDEQHSAGQQPQPVAAAGPREFGTAATGWVGDQIPQVKLDAGIQKYVLLRLSDTRSDTTKLLVWGATAAAYHNHVLQEAKSMVYKLQLADQLTVDVLGGGRIEHYPEQQMLSVYGYSAAFGPAPHEVTAAILQRWFPFYAPDGITISYQGY